jgi:hypothetical protein
MSHRLGQGLAVAWLAAGPAALAQQTQGAAPRPVPGPDSATNEMTSLKAELAEARALLAAQTRQLEEQKQRLDQLERRVTGLAQAPAPAAAAPVSVASATPTDGDGPVRVGQPPVDADRAPTVAVLDQQGTVVTRKGQLVAEAGLDYTRADRNRAIFRGVALIESVLVGVFDINESRQDIVTASGALRYGLTNRLEVGARMPFVYRSDKLVTTPISGSTNDDAARSIDNSVHSGGIGDLELTARYQINNGGRNSPFLIANLQTTVPTGRDPFSVPRNSNGAALKAATGAGFWGISPSITAILPSEPAVLFGTIGYTYNLGRNVNTQIPPVQIDRVKPGNQINISAGVGLALNERTSLNFGYNHAWSFGTTTVTRRLDEKTRQPYGDRITTRSRDLQIGRFLFGVSQRFSDSLLINWAVEVGATEDAPNVRTSIRVPFYF